MPRMDIQSGAIALVLLAVVFAIVSVRSGLRAIQSARKMTFYRLRRQREYLGLIRVNQHGTEHLVIVCHTTVTVMFLAALFTMHL